MSKWNSFLNIFKGKKEKKQKPNPLPVPQPSAVPASLPSNIMGEHPHPLLQPQTVRERHIGPWAFDKLKLIGQGAVGRVYMVRKKGTNHLYAMKVLTKADIKKRNRLNRVLTEREILATVHHPFIVTLYYSFQSEKFLYFVMTYCTGGAFFDMLQKMPNKSLTEDQAKFYAAEVLSGLEYLHVHGFIYRDLKPENILVHETGHIMLTDFDLSKHCTSTAACVEQSLQFVTTEPVAWSQSFVGTPEYMAPEMVSGCSYHTSAVDWWTFGILLYEMLFGRTPFRGRDVNDTFQHILQHTLAFPNFSPVSDVCKDLILKLLHPDPKKRLGFKRGAVEIKAHRFFKDVRWEYLVYQTPPFIPTVPQLDVARMPVMNPAEDAPEYREPEVPTLTSGSDATFKDFTELINEPEPYSR